jgi:hypothetical protein
VYAIGALVALAAALIRIVSKERKTPMATEATDWDALAKETLSREQEPILANTADVTKWATAIIAVLGAIGPATYGLFKVDDQPDAAVLVPIGIVVGASILGIFYAIANDFRTRGDVTAARLAAIAAIAAERAGAAVATPSDDEEERTEPVTIVPLQNQSASIGGVPVTLHAQEWRGDELTRYSASVAGQAAMWWPADVVSDIKERPVHGTAQAPPQGTVT